MPGPRYTLGGDQSLSQGGALGQSCALRSRPCGRVPGRARSLALEGFSQGGHTQASWEKMLPTRLCPVSHSLALVLLCLCRRLNRRSVASGLDSLLVAERWERLGALVCRSASSGCRACTRLFSSVRTQKTRERKCWAVCHVGEKGRQTVRHRPIVWPVTVLCSHASLVCRRQQREKFFQIIMKPLKY